MSNVYCDVPTFLSSSMTNGSFKAIASGTVQYYLDVAGGYVDAALRPRHSIPLSTVPPMLTEWVTVIAAYKLWLFQGINPAAKNQFLVDAYREVMGVPEDRHSGLLKQLAEGELSIGHGEDASSSSPVAMFPVVNAGTDRHWNATAWGPRGKHDIIVG